MPNCGKHGGDGGSESQTEKSDGSKCQTEDMALNANNVASNTENVVTNARS